jgi:hypothetical protein
MDNLLRNPLGLLRTVAMLRKFVPDWSGMATRKGGRGLIDTMILMVRLVLGNLTHHRVASVAMYAFLVGRLVKTQGPRGACIYLKTCHVLLMQSMAQMVLHGSWELGCNVGRTACGLPRIIDRESRALLRSGDTRVLKLWLTLFSFYRVLEFPGILKTSTITSPGPDILCLLEVFAEFVPTFFAHMPGFQVMTSAWLHVRNTSFFQGLGTIFSAALTAKPFLISRSSPIRVAIELPAKKAQLHSSSWPVLVITARRWMTDPLWLDVLTWCALTGNYALPLFVTTISGIVSKETLQDGSQCEGVGLLVTGGRPVSYGPQSLGRLSLKKEPAGKVRVFALVDAFTQWLMKPLHDLLFATLAHIPQDGTFNQERPLKLLLSKLTQEGCQEVASLDLSAATDRLPVALQVVVLRFLIGDSLATLWRKLLVDRDYYLMGNGTDRKSENLRYAVGQPMGALSSWAMLAITHHLIVQMAWYRVCMAQGRSYDWFTGYAVLGDDVVIQYTAVIEAYQAIMAELGVGISLAKSVVGKRVCVEFAKRYFVGETDCSAVSFSEMAVARRNAASALELLRRHDVSDRGLFLRILGVGPFAMTRLEKPISRRVVAWIFLFDFPWLEPANLMKLGSSLWFPRTKRGPWMESQLLPREQRFSFLHVLAYRFSSQLVQSYTSMVRAVAKAPVTAAMEMQGQWSPLDMTTRNLLDAASNLNDDYSMAFYPTGEINQAVMALTDLTPKLESFLELSQVIGLWDLKTLLLNFMEVRGLLDAVRLPVHLDHMQDTPGLGPEKVSAVLKMFLVFKLTLREYRASPMIYGLRQYPAIAKRQAYDSDSIWNSTR